MQGKIFATGLFLILLVACTNDKRNIRDYYFPVEDLRTGRVYEYASETGDTTERRYWYYRSFTRDSGLFMNGTQYDRFFQIVQIMREKIVDNGSLVRNSYLYETDTLTGIAQPITARIESPNLFPFQVTDSLGVFLFRLSYHPGPDSSTTIYIIRNRRFLGDGPEFEFAGQRYPTIRFGLREAVGHDQEGTLEIEGTGEEWYARGLGLVYYRKSFSGGKYAYAFRLAETFPMTEFERRAKSVLQPEESSSEKE